MRIADSQQFFGGLNAILQLQSRTAELQRQIATGKRIDQPADDPVAAAQALAISERIDAVGQFNRNANLAELRLSQQEAVFDTVNSALHRVRDLVLQGKTTTLSDDDRRFIAAEIRERLNELVSLANERNSSGEYMFAGSIVGTQPFTPDAAGNIVYNGDQTERSIQISESRQIVEGFTGHDAFMAIPNGNGTFVTDLGAANAGTGRIGIGTVLDPTTYVAHDFRITFTGLNSYDVIDDTLGVTVLAAQPYVDGAAIAFNGSTVTLQGTPAVGDEFLLRPSQNQSVFDTVKRLIQTLETPIATPRDDARFQFEADRALVDIDQSLDRFRELRATIGARHNSIDSQRQANEGWVVQLEAVKSRLEDVDIVEAVSLLARETNALQAAQAVFVRVQGLSLFNFL